MVKKDPAPAVKKEKLWWEEELELQASLARHPDNPLGREARSFNTVQPMDDDNTVWWSALDIGNFVNLADDEDDVQDGGSDDDY
jgi:hypothetical protein